MKNSQLIERSFTLSKELLDRFEDVSWETDLETNDLVELALLAFLQTKLWDTINEMRNSGKHDC